MNKTEHLLACLIEECAEIQKSAAKALRFGLDDHHPDRSVTNSEEIAHECADLLAIMEMLESEGIILPFKDSQMIQMKKDKVEKYIEYAKGRGTLVGK